PRRGLPASYRAERFWGGVPPSRAKGEEAETDEGQDHRDARAHGDEHGQEGRRHREAEARRQKDAGRINRIIDREPSRGDSAIADEGADERGFRMTEGDRPVEQEV